MTSDLLLVKAVTGFGLVAQLMFVLFPAAATNNVSTLQDNDQQSERRNPHHFFVLYTIVTPIISKIIMLINAGHVPKTTHIWCKFGKFCSVEFCASSLSLMKSAWIQGLLHITAASPSRNTELPNHSSSWSEAGGISLLRWICKK